LSGSDGDSFRLTGNTLVLGENVSANFEAQSSYAITITVRDLTGAVFSKDFQISVVDQNDVPILEIISSIEILENSQGPVVTFSALDEDDPSGLEADYALQGEDAALFSLELPDCEPGLVCSVADDTGRALVFEAAPNFEEPLDNDRDNTYVIQLTVRDGEALVTSELSITVTDALEGRVVDAPLKNANVCLDLNSDSQCSEGEAIYRSDEQGFYNLPNLTALDGINPQIISIGGTDIVTGKSFESLALMARIPVDSTKNVTVTPLSTLLSIADDPDALVESLGIDEGILAEDLIDLDLWWLGTEAEVQAKDEMSAELSLSAGALVSVVEKSMTLSVQIATLMQAADTAIPSTTLGDVQSVQDRALMVTSSVVHQIESAWTEMASEGGSPSLSNPELVETILVETLIDTADEVVTWIETRIESGEIDQDSLDADTWGAILDLKNQSDLVAQSGLTEEAAGQISSIATTTADVNDQIAAAIESAGVDVIADTSSAEALSELVSDTLGAAADLVSGAIDAGQYTENTNVTEIVEQSGGLSWSIGNLVDSDGDGIVDNADADDDGDGVADELDAFPLDASESLDTDQDGTGNNADADDDNDGVLDTFDAFPLDAAETIDTDSDGTGDNADTDDDGDGVADSDDVFPLDSTESVDTDADGTGNNFDTDDDNDGVLDAADAFPLIGLGGLTDTDSDGRPNECDQACVDSVMKLV